MNDTPKQPDAPTPDDTHSPDPGIPPGTGDAAAKAVPDDGRGKSETKPHAD